MARSDLGAGDGAGALDDARSRHKIGLQRLLGKHWQLLYQERLAPPQGPARTLPMNGGVHGWQRRARPLLGTLVEVGLRVPARPGPAGALEGMLDAAFEAAFAAVAEVQASLSRFDPGSDLARFHALPAGGGLRVRPATAVVLAAARELERASAGLFDLSQGSGARGWHCAGGWLRRLDGAVRLDAGGIAKGYAVDAAVHALRRRGCAAGWVNAGGDLRAFGAVTLPLHLRDEQRGGARAIGSLRGGAFATSHFGPGSRSVLARPDGRATGVPVHVSVAAPWCLWADALTKLVAASGDARHPLLRRLRAQAWIHRAHRAPTLA